MLQNHAQVAQLVPTCLNCDADIELTLLSMETAVQLQLVTG